MGQIETKEDDNQNRKSIIKHEAVNEDKSSMADVKIKIDDRFAKDYNHSSGNDNKQPVMDEKGIDNDSDKDSNAAALEEESKAKACDFTCTVFYLMCAVLVFSTMAKTVTFHTGGTCSSVYQVQPIIAYVCVGLAFCIIRRLRQKIKEQVKPQSSIDDELQAIDALFVGENLEQKHYSGGGNETFKSSPTLVLPDIKVADPYPEKKPLDSEKRVHFGTAPNEKPLSVIYPYNNQSNKNATRLPLPMLPPPTGGKRKTAQNGADSSLTVNTNRAVNPVNGNNADENIKLTSDSLAISDKSVSQQMINEISCKNYQTLRPDNLLSDANTYWNSYDLNNMRKF